MAYAAEWSIPALEPKGYPKKEELLSFGTSVGKAAKTFEAMKELTYASPMLHAAMATNQAIPLIEVFLERIEHGKTVTYAKFSFRECRVAEIRYGNPTASRTRSADRFENTDLEMVKVNFGTMTETYGKDLGQQPSTDNWES